MRTLTNLALTALVAVYLLAILAGLVVLCYVAPLWTVVLIPAMAANGWMASDLISKIWGWDADLDTDLL